MSDKFRLKLSIVICTYNRSDFLRNSLSILLPLVRRMSGCQVVVIDNNSIDDTHGVVQEFSDVVYYKEAKQGLSYARNLGLEVSDSEWIAYLDDDAYVDDKWLEVLIQGINNHNFDCFGGVFLPWYRDGKVDWYLDEYSTNKRWLKHEREARLEKQVFSGGNCVFKKNLLIAVGGFPVGIGMTGSTVAYGEEDYVQFKARSMGYSVGFDPALIIYHYVPLKKQTLKWFATSYFAKGKAYWFMSDRSPSFLEFLGLLLVAPFYLAKVVFFSGRRLFSRGYGFRNFLVAIISNLSFQVSRLFYCINL